MWGEVCVGDLHVGRDDGDVHLAAFGDVLHDVLGLRGFAGEQRGHELDRVVGLEPRRVIREQRVGGGVRLVEAVAGELLHQVEDFAGLGFGELAFGCTGHEDLALLGHLPGVFLAHGAAKQVGATERVAADDVRDLHDLLLVDHDAERFAEQRFEFGEEVLDLAAAPLALDEVVDHAHRAGTIERVERGEIFDGVGLVAAKNVAHAAGFKLEDAGGERAVEDLLEGLGVVERDDRHVDCDACGGLDQLQRIVDDGERGQAEEVHLEQAHLFDGLHVVRGDDGVVFGAGDGDEFGERLGRDDDAGGVNACAAHEAFETDGGVDEFADLGVAS